MQVCPNCQTKNKNSAKICTDCGIPIIGSDLKEPSGIKVDHVSNIVIKEVLPTTAPQPSIEMTPGQGDLDAIERGPLAPRLPTPESLSIAPDPKAQEAKPMKRWEVKLPDDTIRQITGLEDIRDELIAGTIPGDLPCRRIATPGKDGMAKESAWGMVADTIGCSGFEGRVMFRPVWAHSIAGLGIGAATGFAIWMLLNVLGGLRSAIELSGTQFNDRGHALASKFAAYAVVSMFWFLTGALPLLAETYRTHWLKKAAAATSPRAFQLAIGGLIAIGMIGQDPSAVFAGLLPGLGSAFGSMIAGALVLGPPGIIIGTCTGLIRTSGLATAARRQRESLWLPLLGGILVPAAISAAVVLLWMRYSDDLIKGVMQSFLR